MTKRPPTFNRQAKRQPVSGWSVRERLSASARGYGAEWRATRAEIMRRDKRLCQQHLKDGISVVATDVDHIIPKHRGGGDNHDNLQALCADCHRIKTAHEGRGARRAT